MLAKLKADYRWKTITAFGLEFVKYEPRHVPEQNAAEAQKHPALEIVLDMAINPEPEKRSYHEPKRPRK